MDIFSSLVVADIVSTIVYALLGVALMGLIWKAVERISPFSLRRELEEDQNIAVAVLMGALFLAIAIIIAAVIVSQ